MTNPVAAAAARYSQRVGRATGESTAIEQARRAKTLLEPIVWQVGPATVRQGYIKTTRRHLWLNDGINYKTLCGRTIARPSRRTLATDYWATDGDCAVCEARFANMPGIDPLAPLLRDLLTACRKRVVADGDPEMRAAQRALAEVGGFTKLRTALDNLVEAARHRVVEDGDPEPTAARQALAAIGC